jgi:hypothetical protein
MLIKSLAIVTVTVLSSLPLSACIDSGDRYNGLHSDLRSTAADEDNYTDGLFDVEHIHRDHSAAYGRSEHVEGHGRSAASARR